MTGRVITQIAMAAVRSDDRGDFNVVTQALCGDGTVWECVNGDAWTLLPEVPQGPVTAIQLEPAA